MNMDFIGGTCLGMPMTIVNGVYIVNN